MHSAEYEKVYAAFIEAQAEFTPVPKNKTAKVKTKTGFEYTYKYADLADVLAMALPVLNRHKLGLLQPHIFVNGRLRLATRVMHATGQWMQSYGLSLPENVEPQVFGSIDSYWRRYDGCSFLGIVAEDDFDGVQTQGSEVRNQGSENRAPVRQPSALPRSETRQQTKPEPARAGEEMLAERDQLVKQLLALYPAPELGWRAQKLFPEHQSTKTLTVGDLKHLYDVLLKEKEAAKSDELSNIPPDVAAMFDDGKLTTASKLTQATIGKGLAQRLHKLIGIHKVHTEDELMEEFMKPLGLEHASDLPRDLYDRLCDWAEGKLEV